VRRRLPFDPWHLVLVPVCLLLAAPLLWMALSSFMNNAQLNRFPPTIIPGSLHVDGYRYLFDNASLPTWFVNSTIVSLV
jgi:multiple sugar transport system permease protein